MVTISERGLSYPLFIVSVARCQRKTLFVERARLFEAFSPRVYVYVFAFWQDRKRMPSGC